MAKRARPAGRGGSGDGNARRLGRPPATSSAETRQRIIDTARQQFGELGYDSTTNAGVAAAADITTGAIYHYFESKEDLYRQVADAAGDTIFGRFEESVDGVEGCVAKLLAALDCALDLEKQDPSLAAFIVSVGIEARRHPELMDVAIGQSDRNRLFFRSILEEGVTTGELAPGTDVDGALEMIRAVMDGLARHAALVRDYDRHEAAIISFQRLLEGNLFARPAPRLVRRAARR